MSLAPGDLIGGKYRLERTLGRGGMGAVWIAVQEPLGRRVALKVIDERSSGDDVTRRRFLREAQSIAKLAHPNIVTLFDFDTAKDGTPWYAMELLEGESLRARVRRTGPVPWRDSIRMIVGVARALKAAHAVGVVHRDIKPENVMIAHDAHAADRTAHAPDGHVEIIKVVDFGVVCL